MANASKVAPIRADGKPPAAVMPTVMPMPDALAWLNSEDRLQRAKWRIGSDPFGLTTETALEGALDCRLQSAVPAPVRIALDTVLARARQHPGLLAGPVEY